MYYQKMKQPHPTIARWKQVCLCILFAVVPVLLAGFINKASGNIAAEFYALTMPPLSPPLWLYYFFGLVFLVVMGVAMYLIYITPETSPGGKRHAYELYVAQIIFTLLWEPVFYGLSAYWAGAAIGLIACVCAALTSTFFRQVNRTAAKMVVITFVWLCYCTYTSFGIALLN